MSDKDYPEKLKLFKEEGSRNQDYYFIIVDEQGETLSTKKWYPIREYGSLVISLSSLSFNTHFRQEVEKFLTVKQENTLDSLEFISGEGFLEEGTVNSRGTPSLSIFGSSHKQKTLSVNIRPRGDDGEEYFTLGGIRGDVGVDINNEEEFFLEFNLTNERFKELKEICLGGGLERIRIRTTLTKVNGLYSEWSEYIGTEFGEIKIFNNDRDIINKEEFDEKLLESVSMRNGFGQVFSIMTEKKVGNFDLTETGFEREQREMEEFISDHDDDKSYEDDDHHEESLMKERMEEVRTNQERFIEEQKLSTLVSIFWGMIILGSLLILTLWL